MNRQSKTRKKQDCLSKAVTLHKIACQDFCPFLASKVNE